MTVSQHIRRKLWHCGSNFSSSQVQSAELTVRETIRFSAQLRLDSNDPVYDSVDGIEGHIDTIIKALELTREVDVLVGSEDDGGLTFEQKKRLSIAVELAANPSIVFLDEVRSTILTDKTVVLMTCYMNLFGSPHPVLMRALPCS